MAMYNKLQIISVTGKENKIIVTRLSTVNRGQYRGMWCIYCCCTKKNREWPGHCYSYQSLVTPRQNALRISALRISGLVYKPIA